MNDRDLLRHSVATLAYRAAKALRDAPADFAHWRPAETTRAPAELLGHMGDLMDWALELAQGRHTWREATPLPWDKEVQRFFDALGRFDAYLASDKSLGWNAEQLFQGPVADALTHVGQLAMLRRLAGSPIKGENYAKADIKAGSVGFKQPPPRFEF